MILPPYGVVPIALNGAGALRFAVHCDCKMVLGEDTIAQKAVFCSGCVDCVLGTVAL